jgi:hypothetical protein
MAMYPEQLIPETVEDLHLPSGLNVQVPKAQLVFRLCSPCASYGGIMPALEEVGQPEKRVGKKEEHL